MSNETPFALFVDGELYSGWQSIRVTRGLERATADFELRVSERWGLQDDATAWQITPGATCEVRLNNELVITGYVDTYRPSYDSGAHAIQLSGRSKTCDFVDSSVLVDGGQFVGMTVAQIAAELAQPYGIEVDPQHDGPPEPEVQVQQGETCFALVERLSRLQGVLVTDDAQGRLVLTRAGNRQSSTALRHGDNIKSASATLDHSKRFSEYIVKAQRPGNSTRADDDAAAPEDDWQEVEPALARLRYIPNVCDRFRERIRVLRAAGGGGAKTPRALTQVMGTVTDEGVRRYRPMVIVAEAQADDGEAMQRAEWEKRRRIANGTKATVTVNGWRQRDGRLWTQNELIEVTAPWLGVEERELIISEVEFTYDDGGELTQLSLTHPDAFLPDPKRKGKKAEGGSSSAATGGRRSTGTKKQARAKRKGKGGGGGDLWSEVI